MWSSNTPEADPYLRIFFPKSTGDQVMPQLFEQRWLMRQTNPVTGQNEKRKYFEEEKEKCFDILDGTEHKRYFIFLTLWSHVELMIKCFIVVEDSLLKMAQEL